VLETQSPNERRMRRSTDPVTALHYQLAHVRREARLEALVLVDDRGCLVAGAGAWPVCEELAAYAPLLEHPDRIQRKTVGARIASLSKESTSLRFELDGTEVVLCGCGPTDDKVDALLRAQSGVRRILGRAA
jgi:hypothetical protein